MKAKTPLFKVLLPVLLLTLNLSCKKDKVEDSPQKIGDVVIPNEVKVIDSQTWNKNFISLDSVSKAITFSKDISSSQSVKTGDIIVSSAGEGLLRKVKSVSTVGNSITVQTESATLTDAIQKGLIEFKQPLNVSRIKSIKYFYGGIKLNKGNIGDLKAGSQNWEINTVLYDNDGNPSTTYDQIKLVGTFNCDWQLIGRIDIGLLEGLKEVKFGFESSENLDLQLIAGLQYNFEKSYKLATVYFTPFVVQVGVVPVVFTPQLDIYAGIEGNANGSVTTGISQNISFNAGMQYLKNQGWSPFTSLNKSLNFQPPTLNVNAGASAYIKPELSVKVYSVVGPYANLKLYERLDANILETPWWKLNAGIKMNAGVKVDILDKFLLECTINDLLKYEVMLSQSTTPPISKPSVTTTNITSYTSSSATVGGNVVTEGGVAITERGVYWGTSSNPETTGTKLQIGSGTGSYTSSLSGLTASTTYYVRAYATNSVGTAYGSQVSFVTTSAIFYGSVSDVDGNSYSTVTIGTQVWMAENLRTTKYKDNTAIPLVTDNTAWFNLSTPGYCWYNNDAATYKGTYGALYNWYTVNTGKLCPTGWHVPTDAEWTTLTTYLGGEGIAGGKLKETGTSHWLGPLNTGATNTTGFTAVPGGSRAFFGAFDGGIRGIGDWWSSTESSTAGAWYRIMSNFLTSVDRSDSPKRSGLSVRCVRD